MIGVRRQIAAARLFFREHPEAANGLWFFWKMKNISFRSSFYAQHRTGSNYDFIIRKEGNRFFLDKDTVSNIKHSYPARRF